MGQKTNPKSFRIGQTTAWNAGWFAVGPQYARQLHQDLSIRRYLKQKLKGAGLAHVRIERSAKSMRIILQSSRPGVVIGRGGAGVEEIKRTIQKDILKDKKRIQLEISIEEVMKPMLSAAVVAGHIAEDLEKRLPFRRTIKRALDQVMKNGAEGAKIIVSGRLDGAEIARREMVTQGKIPLHTIRADIDYSRCAAHTMYGSVGVKVWIYKGEVFHLEKGA